MVDRIVSLWLNAAREFKRAGFLEGEAIGTSLPIGQFTGVSVWPIRQWVCLFRTFKKTALFEWIHSGRLQADIESGRLFCLIR